MHNLEPCAKVAAAQRAAAAADGPGPDPGLGPGSEHYFFSKVQVLVLSQLDI